VAQPSLFQNLPQSSYIPPDVTSLYEGDLTFQRHLFSPPGCDLTFQTHLFSPAGCDLTSQTHLFSPREGELTSASSIADALAALNGAALLR
jgi:hypothetical protein